MLVSWSCLSLTFFESLGGQIARDVRDYGSQLPGGGHVFSTGLLRDQFLTEDGWLLHHEITIE